MSRKNGRSKSRRQVGYAVIGLGHIAQSAVLPAFAHAKNSRMVALVSSDAEKRVKLARKYRCDAYDVRDLDDVLDRSDVDAVYIAEPNDRHADFAVRCAKEGVHVLCEKPLAVTEEECRRMIDACRENGVKLMTAYRLHFEESNLEAVKLIEQGRIGDLRHSVGGKVRVRKFKPADQFAAELIAFSRAVLADTAVEPDGEEGLRDVRTIVAILKSARENRPLTLSWPPRSRRPEPSDRMYRPPVREPRLIGVQAPTLE